MVDSHLKITVSVTGALRLRDDSHYDLCPTCWDTGLSAMTARAAGAVKAVADFAAMRRRDVPVDRPPVDLVNPDTGVGHEFVGECTTCGEAYDLNSVDFTRLYSLLKLPDTRPGDRVFLNPTPPCGHQQPDLRVTVSETGHVDNVEYRRQAAGLMDASLLFPGPPTPDDRETEQ